MALVEVDGGSWRQGGLGQARSVARRVGGRSFFACKYSLASALNRVPLLKAQGNAVISRLPVRRTLRHEFSRGVKRAYLEVEYDSFSLLLVHLSLGALVRRDQLAELAEHCRGMNRPTVLAGDFNVYLGNREVDVLLETTGFRDANPEGIPTYPRRTPRFVLDRVLHSPDLTVRRLAVLDVPYSDHLPMVVDFAAPGEPAPTNSE
jgi:endonuclease/exonuclease/phosphatase family metal-dependent hydrolase